jgi:ParB/RepB/Spo0J family partition protein
LTVIVQSIPIDRIRIEDRARVDRGELGPLAEGIREKGLLQPITLNKNMRLLAGERRLLACQALGWSHIDAVVRDTDDKLDAFEIELMENVLRKDMTWQERAVLEKRIWDFKSKTTPNRWKTTDQAELVGESHGTVNRRIQLAEAMELIPDLADHETEDGAWKEYKKLEQDFATQQLKDKVPDHIKHAAKWAEDHYRIGDALQALAATDPDLAHFAEVDPPYAIDLIEGKDRGSQKHADKYHEIPSGDYPDFFRETARQTYRILRNNSFAVFWYGITWHQFVLETLRDTGFGVPDVPGVWTKGLAGQSLSPDTTMANCYETFFLARKGQPKLAKPGHPNIFPYAPVSAMLKIHRTEKPIDLMLEILTMTCYPGSLICVPFLGSGVTLRAAFMLGHSGWGYDLEEKNKDLFLARVAEDMEMMKEHGVE